MATSSILGGQSAPQRPKGFGTEELGPSDSSDSGSDVQGERSLATQPDDESMLGAVPVDLSSDSDAGGTGERAGALPVPARDGGDILPDHVEDLTDEEDDDN